MDPANVQAGVGHGGVTLAARGVASDIAPGRIVDRGRIATSPSIVFGFLRFQQAARYFGVSIPQKFFNIVPWPIVARIVEDIKYHALCSSKEAPQTDGYIC